MTCSNCSTDLCINRCDTYKGETALVFDQRFHPGVWPAAAKSVEMVISCHGCGCSVFKKVVPGQYSVTEAITMLDVFDGPGPEESEPDVFMDGINPITATFELGSDITCSLPPGFRQCDYSIVAVRLDGTRSTILRGRITVQG